MVRLGGDRLAGRMAMQAAMNALETSVKPVRANGSGSRRKGHHEQVLALIVP
jgi:hypothetical protein